MDAPGLALLASSSSSYQERTAIAIIRTKQNEHRSRASRKGDKSYSSRVVSDRMMLTGVCSSALCLLPRCGIQYNRSSSAQTVSYCFSTAISLISSRSRRCGMVTFVCIHSFAKQEKRGLILDKIPFFLPLQVQCGQADPQPQVTAFSSALASFSHVPPIVTKFLGRWGRGTGSRYVVRYSREIFTLWVENEPVNPGRGRRTRVKGRRW
jgi:hypothetical protein